MSDPPVSDPPVSDPGDGELVGLVVPVGVDGGDAAPLNVVGEVVDGVVRLSWDVPVWGASEVTGYRIVRRRPDLWEREMSVLVADTGSVETVFWDHDAVLDRYLYVYRVQAIRGGTVSVVSPFGEVRSRIGTIRPVGAPRAAVVTGLAASVGSGGVQLSWDASLGAPPLREGAVLEYWVWRERLDEVLNPRAGGLPAYMSVLETSLFDVDVVAGATYRYGISVTNTGVGWGYVRSIASDPVTLSVPALLGDNAPGVARFIVEGVDPVDTADQHRHDVETDGDQAQVSVHANALDAEVSAQAIRADTFSARGQDLSDPVELSEIGDTLLVVHTRSTDNTREQAHILRLRPPTTPDPDPDPTPDPTPKGGTTKKQRQQHLQLVLGPQHPRHPPQHPLLSRA